MIVDSAARKVFAVREKRGSLELLRLVDSIKMCGIWASLRLMCLVFHQSRLLRVLLTLEVCALAHKLCHFVDRHRVLRYVCGHFGSAAFSKAAISQ